MRCKVNACLRTACKLYILKGSVKIDIHINWKYEINSSFNEISYEWDSNWALPYLNYLKGRLTYSATTVVLNPYLFFLQ